MFESLDLRCLADPRDPRAIPDAPVTPSSDQRVSPSTRRGLLLVLQLARLFLAGLVVDPAWAEAPSSAAAAAPLATGRFGQEVARHREVQAGLPSGDVRRIVMLGDGSEMQAFTAGGPARWTGDGWQPEPKAAIPPAPRDLDPAADVRQWAASQDGWQVAATARGLLARRGSDDWQPLAVLDREGRQWGVSDVRGVTFDHQGRLWFATRAGVGCLEQDGWRFYTGLDGLPYNDFTCCAAGGDGSVWFGTRRGAIRFHDGQWSYRQGPRWLPHDEVRDISINAAGDAWLATANGVGCIRREPMTLREKADYYDQEIDRSLKRTPYGYVSEGYLPTAGDKSVVRLRDNDNDGLWTAMYGASQCYAWAVTKSPLSKRRATQAFEALRFLQDVTQGGDPSPPAGYVARSILPTDGPNPNEGQLARDRQTQARDRLWKAYEPRWPRSADGRWYWKSDTSSDELDGHYFLYALYYDLVAETPAEKQRARETVARLTDHLIDHHFVLLDHDGRPTRWANFRPESLNYDIDWAHERGLNSLSMLSYLVTARHMTGDERYARVAEELCEKHAYHTNLLIPKFQRGIGSGNQSDDEMAFMSFYNLLKYTPESDLRQRYLGAFYWYWTLEQPERNPFFHFAYAAFGQGRQISDPFGSLDISPHGDWLQDSASALRGFPLDRIDWPHANSHRLDLIPLPPQNSNGGMGLDYSRQRGYRVDGKVLPVEERFFAHYNTDPWHLDTNGSGHELASGTVFLLPYYMGRYHGFLAD